MYTEKGIIVSVVDYKDMVTQYGVPIEVSSNGIQFVFQKPDDIFNLHIVSFTSDKAEVVKSIYIKGNISTYLEQMKKKYS